MNDITSVTDYLIGKALEDERARIITALEASRPKYVEWGLNWEENDAITAAIAIVRGDA